MKRYNFFIILITGCSFFSSCSKFLDRAPVSLPTDANFWKNEADAKAALAGAYSLLRVSHYESMAYYAYGDAPTDQFVTTLPGEDMGDVGRINWGITFDVTQWNTSRVMNRLRRFDNFYKTNDQINRCLKFIPNIPLEKFTSADKEAARNMLIGEALFLRAYNYFFMARIWGDVPLVLEAEDDIAASKNYPRSPQADVLNQVVKDLQAAIPRLRWGYAVAIDRAVKANRGAAYALLAHVYAWKGDNVSYAKSAEYADSVIKKGGYSFVNRNSYLNIFKGQSSEGIFEISSNARNEASGSISIAFRTLKTPYLLTRTGNAEYRLEVGTVRSLFPDTNDLRVKNGFAFFNTTDPISIKYSNIIYTSTNALGQPISPLSLNNIIIFRYSDIVLLRAEALVATGMYGEARTLLNSVRSQANATPFTGADNKLFEAVMDERARELFIEGHRFYDLVRLGRKGILKFGGTRMSDAEFNNGKYYWPIDPVLINFNRLLVQTPYWRDKL
jgi:hypothetical protein